MKKKHPGYALLACAALFGLSLSTLVSAADAPKLVETCTGCHGEAGANTEADVPNIGSYSAEYTSSALNRFKIKTRPCTETEFRSGSQKGKKTSMCQIASNLSDSDINQLAEYYAEQEFVRKPQNFDAALAEKGKPLFAGRCQDCHGDRGTLAADNAGILGGQKMAYLTQQLKDFKEGKRPYTEKQKRMKQKLEAATDDELKAIVNYLGSIQE